MSAKSKRKIVFVVGADFSGTTFLDLSLGSSPLTASVGELASIVSPTSRNHKKPVCSCHTECGLWNSISEQSENPYSVLFEFHGTDTIIDSSKQPDWILKQARNARKRNQQTFIVLIWKSADEYAEVVCKPRKP